MLTDRLRHADKELANLKKETINYQNMLQQSQTQFAAIDRKYNKAKRLVRDYQQRELDMVHQEEVYLQLLQEKDTEYNALVKKLKDRVINLEQELQDTQRKAGFPVELPYDSASLRLTPQLSRRQPPKPLFQKLDSGLSDTEISDLSPDGDDDKTATVERKIPVKDELDAVVPPHELLDSSANRSKCDLVSRGGMAKRHAPTGKKSMSNSSSDCGLNESDGEMANISESTNTSHSTTENGGHHNGHYNTSNNLLRHKVIPSTVESVSSTPPLYAQVHKDRSGSDASAIGHHFVSHSTIPNIYKNSATLNDVASVGVSSELTSSYDSIIGSSDRLSENGGGADNWMYPSRRRGPGGGSSGPPKTTPTSFTDQLNQVLSEREK